MILKYYTDMVWDGTFLSKKLCISGPKNPVGYLIQPCLMLETFQPLAKKRLLSLLSILQK